MSERHFIEFQQCMSRKRNATRNDAQKCCRLWWKCLEKDLAHEELRQPQRKSCRWKDENDVARALRIYSAYMVVSAEGDQPGCLAPEIRKEPHSAKLLDRTDCFEKPPSSHKLLHESHENVDTSSCYKSRLIH
jgi:hypothetical protein